MKGREKHGPDNLCSKKEVCVLAEDNISKDGIRLGDDLKDWVTLVQIGESSARRWEEVDTRNASK